MYDNHARLRYTVYMIIQIKYVYIMYNPFTLLKKSNFQFLKMQKDDYSQLYNNNESIFGKMSFFFMRYNIFYQRKRIIFNENKILTKFSVMLSMFFQIMFFIQHLL